MSFFVFFFFATAGAVFFSIHFAETLWVLVGKEIPINDVLLCHSWHLDCVAVGALLAITVIASVLPDLVK
jgi:hypothetical protein